MHSKFETNVFRGYLCFFTKHLMFPGRRVGRLKNQVPQKAQSQTFLGRQDHAEIIIYGAGIVYVMKKGHNGP